ncbi:hypothetical protein IGK06_003423 [Enterococcus sp. AZ142]
MFEKEEFFHYEFSLFNNFLTYFDDKFISLLLPTVECYLNTVSMISEYKIEKIIFYINLAFNYLNKNRNLSEFKKIFSELSLLIEDNLFDIPILQYYKYELLYSYVRGNISKEKFLLLSKMNKEETKEAIGKTLDINFNCYGI